ncbi:ATP-binding protein [Amycolatopsis sp. NPDC004169]|uniref:sensor histidine kinase n=1 Tax=Amycolatopsis sp. NPDC004169 TaxID=3154453 RepID=UPI0033AB45D1
MAGIGFGMLTVLVDTVSPIPMPADPIAALSVALSAGVLAVWLSGMRWLRRGSVLIAVGALIVGAGYLIGGPLCLSVRIAALVFLVLALLCAVPGWPELGRLLNQTKARSVIRFQNYHAARIADELHDEVLQALAMTSRRLDSAARGGDAEQLIATSRAAVETLNDQAAVLRSIVGTLHPVSLRHVGLVAGTRELARHVAAANGLVIDVEIVDTAVAALDPEIETVAYRVVQEALTNVVKHAAATTVQVQMVCDRHQLTITVTDDGRGLLRPRAPANAGYGLESMRWWSSAYGGDLTVSNCAGGGARLRATFLTQVPDATEVEVRRAREPEIGGSG